MQKSILSIFYVAKRVCYEQASMVIISLGNFNFETPVELCGFSSVIYTPLAVFLYSIYDHLEGKSFSNIFFTLVVSTYTGL